MPKCVIVEQITARIEIEADTADQALKDWLTLGQEARSPYLQPQESVDERWVEDEHGVACDTEHFDG